MAAAADPTSPPGSRLGSGPADSVATTSAEFFGDSRGAAPVLPSRGHTIVFWNFSATESFMYGVPGSADLVCVLKVPTGTSG